MKIAIRGDYLVIEAGNAGDERRLENLYDLRPDAIEKLNANVSISGRFTILIPLIKEIKS
jgi:hypothetical protein